ncbi:peptidase s41 family [Pyrenophora seminiperda CCB06]|uniref:Peptidase s41 family n=1 Tax=Pyrenophora seminiperda CCB06 TaxID=1302712 RepID=A0A3M7LVC7_9PLEO|nr:peptidase s41 family [Pyrenophora seminiperda CCB06]
MKLSIRSTFGYPHLTMLLRNTISLALAALVAAQAPSSEPCAIVASELTKLDSIPAQLAFDCLESVPVDVQGNTKLIEELKILWEFQSEIIWLKNPGNEWEYGALDIQKELDNIKSNINSFSSEYALQLAIQNITIRTGNFHFNYRPDILEVFYWSRQISVASISQDGKALPKLYVADDVALLAQGSKDVSDITNINGQKPYDFLKSASRGQYIDSDGLINDMLAKGDTQTSGSFMNQSTYGGNMTDITWANGSTKSIPNSASSPYNFSGVSDGKSFFDTFCRGNNDTDDDDDAMRKRAETGAVTNHFFSRRALGEIPTIPSGAYHSRNKRQIPTATYPTAVAEASSGVVAGYFLSGQGYEDVAVLKIISFNNPTTFMQETNFNNEFQSTVASFLRQCISTKKQKLIIDLRENGGGNTNLLLDAFMQLFPDMEPFSGQRYRATDAFLKMGNAINEMITNPVKANAYRQEIGESLDDEGFFRYWLWNHFRNSEGVEFTSWDDFNGPVQVNNDKYTTTVRYNYTDDVSIIPEGFSFLNGTRPMAFSPSNIVMYTDALCGSSCASFHEELKNIAGIKSVTVGGRPENKPIQAVTGTKGGEVLPLNYYPGFAEVILNISSKAPLTAVSATDATLESIANVPQVLTRAGDDSSRLQSQDQVRKGDRSGTPLQYIYEASDCRLFYTPVTYADTDAAWKQAWDAFLDEGKCVEGSTKHKSSISGGFKPYGPGELKAVDQPKGAGAQSGAASGVRFSGVTVSVAAVVFSVVMAL